MLAVNLRTAVSAMAILSKPKLVLIPTLSAFVSFKGLLAQSWTQTLAPITNWSAISCSADGSAVAAAAGGWKSGSTFYPPGPLYLSTNSGASWNPSNAPVTNWNVMTMSADGSKLFAGLYQYFRPDPIYASVDGGATWTPTGAPSTNDWIWLHCSADGQTVAAAFPSYGQVPGGVFVSTNSGGAWGQPLQDYFDWPSVACSAEGRLMVASTGFGYPPLFYRSTDSGQTWTALAPTNVPNSLLLEFSADGTKLIGANPGGGIFISTDHGDSWQATSAPSLGWGSISCSAEAQTVIAAFGSHDGSNPVTPGPVYFSRDSGTTWTPAALAPANWASVACSADGAKLFAADSNGGIYTLQTTPHPVLRIIDAGSNLVLSWIIPSLPFVLQQSSGLDGGWSDIPATPVPDYTNLEYKVSVPEPTGTAFYRLVAR
jgi:photosystem II stability/assembly factor-like uncharacterized protein